MNKFTVTVVTEQGEFEIKGLTEKQALKVLTNAYECVDQKKEEIVFSKDLKIKALDLKYFYIN